MSDFEKTVFPQILDVYENCRMKHSSAERVVLRLVLRGAYEAENFVKFYSRITHTNYIIAKLHPFPKRLLFSKVWSCQHSKRNKKAVSKRNVYCKSGLKIIIKKVNRDTKRNDTFLMLNPPLSAEVVISLIHTHSTASTESLRMLRVEDAVKEKFFSYFDSGMTPAEAIKFHKNLLLFEENIEEMDNASLNPKVSQVHYLQNRWRISGSSRNSSEKLRGKRKSDGARAFSKIEFRGFTERDMDCPQKARMFFSLASKLKKEKSAFIKSMQRRESRLQKRVHLLEKTLTQLRTSTGVTEEAARALEEKVNETVGYEIQLETATERKLKRLLSDDKFTFPFEGDSEKSTSSKLLKLSDGQPSTSTDSMELSSPVVESTSMEHSFILPDGPGVFPNNEDTPDTTNMLSDSNMSDNFPLDPRIVVKEEPLDDEITSDVPYTTMTIYSTATQHSVTENSASVPIPSDESLSKHSSSLPSGPGAMICIESTSSTADSLFDSDRNRTNIFSIHSKVVVKKEIFDLQDSDQNATDWSMDTGIVVKEEMFEAEETSAPSNMHTDIELGFLTNKAVDGTVALLPSLRASIPLKSHASALRIFSQEPTPIIGASKPLSSNAAIKTLNTSLQSATPVTSSAMLVSAAIHSASSKVTPPEIRSTSHKSAIVTRSSSRKSVDETRTSAKESADIIRISSLESANVIRTSSRASTDITHTCLQESANVTRTSSLESVDVIRTSLSSSGTSRNAFLDSIPIVKCSVPSSESAAAATPTAIAAGGDCTLPPTIATLTSLSKGFSTATTDEIETSSKKIVDGHTDSSNVAHSESVINLPVNQTVFGSLSDTAVVATTGDIKEPTEVSHQSELLAKKRELMAAYEKQIKLKTMHYFMKF